MATLAENLSVEISDLMIELNDDGLAQECEITMRQSGTYDPDTGTVPVTESTQTVIGAIFDPTSSPSTLTNIDNSLIKSGDQILLLSPIDTEGGVVSIESDYIATVDNKKYTVVAAGKIAPGGTVMAYNAILRG